MLLGVILSLRFLKILIHLEPGPIKTGLKKSKLLRPVRMFCVYTHRFVNTIYIDTLICVRMYICIFIYEKRLLKRKGGIIKKFRPVGSQIWLRTLQSWMQWFFLKKCYGVELACNVLVSGWQHSESVIHINILTIFSI